MTSFKQIIEKLKTAGIKTAELDAEILLAHTLNCSRADLILMDVKEIPDSIHNLVERRCLHEPIAYITGKKEFWDLEFVVNKNVLIPRPETEGLIEQLLLKFPDTTAPLRFLDLGTGSGCIVLSALNIYKNAFGVAVDISNEALQVAKQNAENLGISGVDFIESNWFSNLDKKEFDVIFSNPPYITHDEEVEIEVRKHEPHNALYGGLEPYKIIAEKALEYLSANGIVMVEIGHTQGEQVSQIFKQHNFQTEIIKDLAGKDRIIISQRF